MKVCIHTYIYIHTYVNRVVDGSEKERRLNGLKVCMHAYIHKYIHTYVNTHIYSYIYEWLEQYVALTTRGG